MNEGTRVRWNHPKYEGPHRYGRVYAYAAAYVVIEWEDNGGRLLSYHSDILERGWVVEVVDQLALF